MPDPQPPAFYAPSEVPGQLTIWDELVDEARRNRPQWDRLCAGMISHLGLLPDAALIRVGVVARREEAKALKRHATSQAVGWQRLVDACICAWLSRHPRPHVGAGE